MALPPRLGLNCLTPVLVSASLWWMDGCQHDSVTHSPLCVLLCLDVYFLFLHSSTSSSSSTLTPSFSAFNHLTVPVFLSLCFFFSGFLPAPCLPHRISAFLLLSSCRFLPLICAVDCLPEQHVAGGETKTQEWGGKKAHWQKLLPPSLLVAAEKKYINYLHDWMMLAQLWGCCLCWDEWCSSARRRFLCRLVFVFRIQPHHQ